MPRRKDLKRVVRTRMKKTGESYTAARAHVIEKPAPAEPAAPAPAEVAAPDYAALAGMSDEKVAGKTGRDWARWVRTLDGEGADRLAHREIARLVHEKYEVDGWWSQSVAVGYERIKGLREKGQQRSGTYEVGKSRTLDVPVTVLFDAWADERIRSRWLTDANPVMRTATRPRTLRLGWEDGTLVVVGFTEKGPARSVVSVAHTKLPDRAAADRMKQYWSAKFDALGEVLSHLPSV